MRKLFECGHRGKGKFCNRCKIEEKQRILEKSNLSVKLMKKETRAFIYTTLGKRVGSIPEHIAYRAYSVWSNLLGSKSIHKIQGWRKLTAKTLGQFVVFDFGKEWRLIASLNDDECHPIGLFSHQEYNNWLSKMVKK